MYCCKLELSCSRVATWSEPFVIGCKIAVIFVDSLSGDLSFFVNMMCAWVLTPEKFDWFAWGPEFLN